MDRIGGRADGELRRAGRQLNRCAGMPGTASIRAVKKKTAQGGMRHMDLHLCRFAIACTAPIAAVAGIVLSAPPVRAQQFTMKFSTQTLNDLQHEFMKVYKTELEQATNGR